MLFLHGIVERYDPFLLPPGLPAGQYMPSRSPSFWISDAPVAESVTWWSCCQEQVESTNLHPVLCSWPNRPGDSVVPPVIPERQSWRRRGVPTRPCESVGRPMRRMMSNRSTTISGRPTQAVGQVNSWTLPAGVWCCSTHTYDVSPSTAHARRALDIEVIDATADHLPIADSSIDALVFSLARHGGEPCEVPGSTAKCSRR
jgi:hypothetical protein